MNKIKRLVLVIVIGLASLVGSLSIASVAGAAAPTTSVLIPSSGQTLVGTSTALDASASSGTTSVGFYLFGGIYGFSPHFMGSATSTYFGWVTNWDSTTVPNNNYTIVSAAENSQGQTGYSSGTPITVSNLSSPSGFTSGEKTLEEPFGGSLNTTLWHTELAGEGGSCFNCGSLPSGDSAAGLTYNQNYFTPGQIGVGIDSPATLTMVPDSTYHSDGYNYRSGVIDTYSDTSGWLSGSEPGYLQVSAKLPDVAANGVNGSGNQDWPAIWLLDPNGDGSSAEIDLQEGGFCCSGISDPNKVLSTTYHDPAGDSGVGFQYQTSSDMDSGYHTYGVYYDPGVEIETFFDGTMVGKWTTNISTSPYELIIDNTMANSSAGFHLQLPTGGTNPNPAVLSVQEVQEYES